MTATRVLGMTGGGQHHHQSIMSLEAIWQRLWKMRSTRPTLRLMKNENLKMRRNVWWSTYAVVFGTIVFLFNDVNFMNFIRKPSTRLPFPFQNSCFSS